jgi:hypothetical protein
MQKAVADRFTNMAMLVQVSNSEVSKKS